MNTSFKDNLTDLVELGDDLIDSMFAVMVAKKKFTEVNYNLERKPLFHRLVNYVPAWINSAYKIRQVNVKGSRFNSKMNEMNRPVRRLADIAMHSEHLETKIKHENLSGTNIAESFVENNKVINAFIEHKSDIRIVPVDPKIEMRVVAQGAVEVLTVADRFEVVFCDAFCDAVEAFDQVRGTDFSKDFNRNKSARPISIEDILKTTQLHGPGF